jgi:transcriptional regulator with XRE-family HTH domain
MPQRTDTVKTGESRIFTQDARKLRRKRLEAGLTGAQLAALAGTSKVTISLLENRHQSARPGMLAALAAALGCKPADLMPDEDAA